MPNPKAYDYMHDEHLLKLINQCPEYKKKERTDLRRAKDTEIGEQHVTYVWDKATQRKRPETSNVISPGCVVARNRRPICRDDNGFQVYNEWLIPADTVIKNYGQEVYDGLSDSFPASDSFPGYAKKTTIKALRIDDKVFEFFEQLECVEKGKIYLKVSWGEMFVQKGDYLTNQEYAISDNDMDLTYELITPPTKEKESEYGRFFEEQRRRKVKISITESSLVQDDVKRLSGVFDPPPLSSP